MIRRFGRNLRSTGTSYAMSSPISSAAMPPEALHSAITTPMIRAVSELCAVLVVADVTAVVNTSAAPGGSALLRPFTSLSMSPLPSLIRVVRPTSAISAGNKARNQW